MDNKTITISLPLKVINDFKGHAGAHGYTGSSLIKKWILDYVAIENEKDQRLLEKHRESLTPKE